jgi:hypothetical protein
MVGWWSALRACSVVRGWRRFKRLVLAANRSHPAALPLLLLAAALMACAGTAATAGGSAAAFGGGAAGGAAAARAADAAVDLDNGRRLYELALAAKQAEATKITLVKELRPLQDLPQGALDVSHLRWVEIRPQKKHGQPQKPSTYKALIPAVRLEDFKRGEAARGPGGKFLLSSVRPATGYAILSCPSRGVSYAVKQERKGAAAAEPTETTAPSPECAAPGDAPPRTRGPAAVASGKVECPARFVVKTSRDFAGYVLITYVELEHVDACHAQGTRFLSPEVRTWVRDQLLANPDMRPHRIVTMNVERLALEYVGTHGSTVAEVVATFNAVRLPATLVGRSFSTPCLTLLRSLSPQTHSLAPRDFWLSTSDVWNVKLEVDSALWRLDPDVLRSLAAFVALPQHGNAVFTNQTQVTAAGADGVLSVRGGDG